MIPTLQDAFTKSETFLIPYIKSFLSTLLVVPDNPERGVLSLVRILLNVLREFDWNKQNCALGTIYVNVIDMLSVMAQEIYPYHVDKGKLTLHYLYQICLKKHYKKYRASYFILLNWYTIITIYVFQLNQMTLYMDLTLSLYQK